MDNLIEFRGLRTDGKGWVYGVPYFLNIEEEEPEDCVSKACIITGADWDGTCGFMSPDNNCFIEVIPETVGQFTGLTDKNGTEIYEGDKVVFHAITCGVLQKGYCQDPYKKGQEFFVKKLLSGFTLSTFQIKESDIPNQVGHVDNYTFWNHHRSFEVIGNIHQESEVINE